MASAGVSAFPGCYFFSCRTFWSDVLIGEHIEIAMLYGERRLNANRLDYGLKHTIFRRMGFMSSHRNTSWTSATLMCTFTYTK
jgi:hypothetical protein